jgi:lysyl-tRNA synthetase class 2
MADEHGRPQDALRAARVAKWEALKAQGRDPFRITKYARTHEAGWVVREYPANAGANVSVAGRVTAIRRHGKAAFLDLRDESGRVQVHVRQDSPDAFFGLEAGCS